MQAIAVSKLKPESGIQARAKRIAHCFLDKGFPYVKVELEAHVQPEGYSSESECCDCHGDGSVSCGSCNGTAIAWITCTTCSGRGIIENSDGQTQSCPDCHRGQREVRCPDCTDGYVNCGECNGRGSFEDSEWYEGYLDDFWGAFSQRLGEALKLTEYARVYYDGSVDTEFTFTIHVDYICSLPEIITAFRETCLSFGRCQTNNAGLHITLLSDKKYPIEAKLDGRKLSNFKRQVSKLLLGLVCLGSPDGSTRAFEFRDLEISDRTKYSAIFTHDETCIEYHLFDACFEKPEYIIIYLELICMTLHYYADRRYMKLKDHISLKRSGEILNKEYRGCYRKLVDVFKTDESMARLFRELAYLVRRNYRLWLECAYMGYSSGFMTKDRLMANLVAELKG